MRFIYKWSKVVSICSFDFTALNNFWYLECSLALSLSRHVRVHSRRNLSRKCPEAVHIHQDHVANNLKDYWFIIIHLLAFHSVCHNKVYIMGWPGPMWKSHRHRRMANRHEHNMYESNTRIQIQWTIFSRMRLFPKYETKNQRMKKSKVFLKKNAILLNWTGVSSAHKMKMKAHVNQHMYFFGLDVLFPPVYASWKTQTRAPNVDK